MSRTETPGDVVATADLAAARWAVTGTVESERFVENGDRATRQLGAPVED